MTTTSKLLTAEEFFAMPGARHQELVRGEIVEPMPPGGLHIEHNVFEYLAAGTAAVWVVYPRSRRVTVHTPDGLACTFDADAPPKSPDLLPGFSCPVREFFV